MKIITPHTNKQKKNFIDFAFTVYENFKAYRDNFSHSAKDFLYKRTLFAKETNVTPLLVVSNHQIVARAMLLQNEHLNALQVGFFEALPNAESAVGLILTAAQNHAQKNSLPSVIVGLNGHLCYGVGFLKNGFKQPASFDGIYTPPYYPAYFNQRGMVEHGLTTYYASSSNFLYSPKLFEKAYKNFAYRCINLKNLKAEAAILGELFNSTLKNTPFYSFRSITNSYELLKALSPLIKNENIIYAMHSGKEIGFVLWHPNFNELIKNNAPQSKLLFFLKYKLLGHNINEYKINTIGVLPEFENSGASFGLVNEVYKRVKGRYSGGETAFVWDDNTKSKHFCTALCKSSCRQYVVFEQKL